MTHHPLTTTQLELVDETATWILAMLEDYEENYRETPHARTSPMNWVHYFNDDRTRHLWIRRPDHIAELFYATTSHGWELMIPIYWEVWICDTDVVHFSIEHGNSFHGLDNFDTVPQELETMVNCEKPYDPMYSFLQITMKDYAS